MPNLDQAAATALKVEMAELRTDVRHLSHDMKNLAQKLDAVVTRRELEQIHERRDERHDEHHRRLTELEDHRDKLVWGIVSAWLAGLGVVFRKLI